MEANKRAVARGVQKCPFTTRGGAGGDPSAQALQRLTREVSLASLLCIAHIARGHCTLNAAALSFLRFNGPKGSCPTRSLVRANMSCSLLTLRSLNSFACLQQKRLLFIEHTGKVCTEAVLLCNCVPVTHCVLFVVTYNRRRVLRVSWLSGDWCACDWQQNTTATRRTRRVLR